MTMEPMDCPMQTGTNIDFDFNVYAAPGGSYCSHGLKYLVQFYQIEWTNSSSTGELMGFHCTGYRPFCYQDHTTGSGYFAAVDDSESPHSTDVTLTTSND